MSCFTLGSCVSHPHFPPTSPAYCRGYAETRAVNGQGNTERCGNTGAVSVPLSWIQLTRGQGMHQLTICLVPAVQIPLCPVTFSQLMSGSRPVEYSVVQKNLPSHHHGNTMSVIRANTHGHECFTIERKGLHLTMCQAGTAVLASPPLAISTTLGGRCHDDPHFPDEVSEAQRS